MAQKKLFDKKNTPLVLPAKDRLETRPPGTLPTPLDPASPEAIGWPLDPKVDANADDGSQEPAGGRQKSNP